MAACDEDEPQSLPELPSRVSRLLPDVKELYSTFSCKICYEPMKNPVMTIPCSHNFCSICVRKYLLYKQQCPSCFGPLRDTELKANRILSETMELFAKLVPNLNELVKELRPDFKLPQAKTPQKSSEKKRFQPQESPSPKPRPVSPTFPTQTQGDPRPSTSVSPLSLSSASTQGQSQEPQGLFGKRVDCPVCKVSVLEKNVNAHLDKCLAEQNGELPKPEPAAISRNNMKSMKQPVYYLLKDNDIKKQLREHGLETKGARKVLEQRLKSFIALWNAQCDLDKPLTKLEMIMKLKRDEKNLQKLPLTSVPPTLNFDRQTDPKVIESKQRDYMQQNKDHFAKLIEKAKANKGQKVTKSSSEEKSEDEILEIGETNVTKDINDLTLTPKRKQENEEIEGQSPAKRSRFFDVSTKPMYSKRECPICQENIAENLLQSHVERCLNKPEPRQSASKFKKGNGKNVKNSKRKRALIDELEETDEEDIEPDLLNATPDIIVEDDEELICSTPVANKENVEARKRTTRSQNKEI